MSKYVNYKHGLVIGSDNTFFVIDQTEELPEGVDSFRDGYRAILNFNSYSFEQISTLNVFIRTPAQQLVWDTKLSSWTELYTNRKGETTEIPSQVRYEELKPHWCNWLTMRVGNRYHAWDAYTRNRSNSLFFKKRSDALSMMKEISRILKGVTINV